METPPEPKKRKKRPREPKEKKEKSKKIIETSKGNPPWKKYRYRRKR